MLAFSAGGLWAFCFGREPLLLAPWLGLVPLFVLVSPLRPDSSSGPGERLRPGLIGWFHGLGFWVVGTSWIPATLRTFGGLPWWLAVGTLVLMAAYLGLFHACFAWLGASYWRKSGWLAWVAPPALWVALEVLRSHLLTGFPWNLAGYSAAGTPGALESAAWLGPYGLSAVVVFANVAVARSLLTRSWTPALWTCLSLLAFFAVAGRVAEGQEESGATRSITLMQPNIPNQTAWDPEQAEADYRRVFDLSRAACSPDELLVWPESAAWPYSYVPGSRLHRDVAELVSGGCTLLFNSPVKEGEGFYNAAFLASAESSKPPPSERPTTRYDKQHLVPFGEYVPLGRWLPFLESVARAAGDFSVGPRSGNLDWFGESLGAAICFEVTFPGEVARKVDRGASILVTMTNDAWYGDTWAPWQHLRAAQFRAAENRRPLVRAAITGVSAVISSRGALSQTLGVNQQGTLRSPVVGGTARTLYTRAPQLVPLLAFSLAAFAIFRLVVEGRKR